MNNGYNIEIVEEYGTLKVFLEPQCGHELHRKKIGYLEDDNTFHCIDSDLLTLEVMEAIVCAWKIYIVDVKEIPI
tara:strand:+ start:615 stop:839 length:225 start_codon:yes stop_codon:yes gene_type:complete